MRDLNGPKIEGIKSLINLHKELPRLVGVYIFM